MSESVRPKRRRSSSVRRRSEKSSGSDRRRIQTGSGSEPHKTEPAEPGRHSCYLCREEREQTLELRSKVNENLRYNLEHVFECSLAAERVCYPCRNDFESAVYQMVEFKNKFLFAPGKEMFSNYQLSEKDHFCVLCGVAPNRKSLQGCVVLSEYPEVQDFLSAELRDPVDPSVYSCIICQKCFRLSKKILWMSRELTHLETKLNKIFTENRTKMEKDLLLKDSERNCDLKDLYLEVRSISLREDHANLSKVESKSLPPGAVLSSLFISEFFSSKPVLERLELFTKDDKYLCIQLYSLRSQQFSFSLENMKLILHAREIVNECQEEKFRCRSCEFRSPYLHILLSHLLTHAPPEPPEPSALSGKLYRCAFCGEEFNRKSVYKTHGLLCKPALPLPANIECDRCGKFLKTKEALAVHVARDHLGSRAPWSCALCKKTFTRKASYEEHVTRHKGIRDKYCDVCDRYFFETAYWRHRKLVHPSQESLRFSCDICSRRFAQQFKLKQHLAVHLTEDEKGIVCDVDTCKKKFASAEKLKNHMRSVHSTRFSNGSLVCGECGATYSNYISMCGHIKRCHNPELPRPLPCADCPQTFPTSAALNKHRTIHHNSDRLYFCGFSECKRAFSDLMELHRHQESGHRDGTEQLQDQDGERIIYMGEIKEMGTGLNLAQPFTDQKKTFLLSPNSNGSEPVRLSFENSKPVELILREPDPNLAPDPQIGDSAEQITTVVLETYMNPDQEAPTELRLSEPGEPEEIMELVQYSDTKIPQRLQAEHVPSDRPEDGTGEPGESLIVGNNLNLENCPDALFILSEDSGNQLIQAFEYDISEQNEVRCGTCPMTFYDAQELLLHSKICPEETEKKCSTCRRNFPSPAALEEHMKVHNAKKKFICHLCEKAFSTNKILKRHLRVHTGERPYECEFCFKKFGAASNLSEHRTLHTGRLAYTCRECGAKFRLWSSLNKHAAKCEGGEAATVAAFSQEEDNKEELLLLETETMDPGD